MPRDQFGGFHLNTQRAHAQNKLGKPEERPMPGKPKGDMPEKDDSESGGKVTELHDMGDGSFKTKSHDGEETDHPHIGHALMHLAAKHSEGKHFHAHHDGMSITSHHHLGEGHEPEGPHEHGSGDEAADHMKSVMGDEQDDSQPDYGDDGGDMSLAGM